MENEEPGRGRSQMEEEEGKQMQVEEKQSSWKRMSVCEDEGDGCSAQRGQCEQKCEGESLEGRAHEQGWWVGGGGSRW